jgi:hypothetical protein
VGPKGLEPRRLRALRESVFVRESTRTCCGAQGMKAQGEGRAVRDSVLVRGSTRMCCGAQGIRAQAICAIRESVFVRESTRTCCGARGMIAQGEENAVR